MNEIEKKVIAYTAVIAIVAIAVFSCITCVSINNAIPNEITTKEQIPNMSDDMKALYEKGGYIYLNDGTRFQIKSCTASQSSNGQYIGKYTDEYVIVIGGISVGDAIIHYDKISYIKIFCYL